MALVALLPPFTAHAYRAAHLPRKKRCIHRPPRRRRLLGRHGSYPFEMNPTYGQAGIRAPIWSNLAVIIMQQSRPD